MNISKEKLEELEGMLEIWRQKAEEGRFIERDLQKKINNFDDILDKITRAAQGLPLIQNRDVTAYSMGVNMGDNGMGHRCVPPSVEELQTYTIERQQAHIVDLESRLAAVTAVAIFAKEHKA